MAELNYGDVQRAVSEAVGQLRGPIDDLRSSVNSVAHEMEKMRRTRAQMEEVLHRVGVLEQMIAQLGQQLQHTRQAAIDAQRASQGSLGISQQLGQLQVRFQAVEKFAGDVSSYLQYLRQQEEEDQGYRRTTG